MKTSCNSGACGRDNLAGRPVKFPVVKGLNWLAILLMVLIAIPRLCLAQGTSAIQGHIADSSGASVPKALIKVTNENTGLSRTAYSADDGYYRIADLLPGTYTLRLELSGFKTVTKSAIPVTAESVTGLNFTLEVGEVTQTIDVTGQESQIETEVARISEVINEKQIKSLPIQGRGVMNLAVLTPGIQGKAESTVSFSFFCCDAFSNYAAPIISSGGTENKSNFSVDGLTLRYVGGSYWGALFSPNVDAVEEVRISTNPTQADYGTTSGPQINFITKGGTNDWHGTAHFTNIDSALNARPFFASEKLPSYTRYYGGTAGGPIIKNRLFVFGGFQGLRERRVPSSVDLIETQAFRDFVVNTRPNSVGAAILQDAPPVRYPTTNLVDLGSPLPGLGVWSDIPDGIPEYGELSGDYPRLRNGSQYNARIDYHSPSANDRIYGSYWYTRPEVHNFPLRPTFEDRVATTTHSGSLTHTHSFSPQTLNEFRLGIMNLVYDHKLLKGSYHIPTIFTDDGILGIYQGWNDEYESVRITQVANVLSVNRGRHSFKVGGYFRHNALTNDYNDDGDIPQYYFSSILDFADDEPYYELRNLDFKTGKVAEQFKRFNSHELSFFFQDVWQISPNLTLNYGLRWEVFAPTWYVDRDNWAPVITSAQLTPASIAALNNVKVDRFADTDWNNFGPRLGLAWDPTGQRKMSIRGGFGILYDEAFAGASSNNPPANFQVSAGPDFGIPIFYGIAPVGTLDFPTNPALSTPELNDRGGVVGTRVGLGASLRDLKTPQIWDVFGGIQYELLTDLKVEFDYKYRRNTNDVLGMNFNRFTGDLLDGLLDRYNPIFSGISLTTNLGRRIYHGLIFSASKRFSQGWLLSAAYTYNHATTNIWGSRADGEVVTDPTNPKIDLARDEIPDVFTLHSVWELPILRGRSGWLAGALGGWQLNTIWNLQSGGIFSPRSTARFVDGGDFNADGLENDRPDRPSGDVSTSFDKQQWLAGAFNASVLPRPDPASPRAGTLPRDFFRGPGYARIDAALSKDFPIPGREGMRLQFRAEAFNLFNRLNMSFVENVLEDVNFARALDAHQNRTMQLSIKFYF